MRLRPIHLVSILALSAPAGAAQLNVAVAAAATTSLATCNYVDVQAYLLASGHFGTVDIVNVVTATPTLAELMNYDAVLTWSNIDYADPVTLGNHLADYVDAGGGVVVAVFANSSTTPNRSLGGRWAWGGYEVIPATGGNTSGDASLGAVLDPGHPVMQGVTSFQGGPGSFRPTTTSLAPGSRLIARWNDGKTLVAEHASLRRIDLGMYPVSDVCFSTFWTAGTDGDVLVANALAYVGGDGVVGTAYCFGDGSGTPCPCANFGGEGEGCANSTTAGAVLGGSGSASVAAGDLVLSGRNLPPGQPGLYYQANNLTNGGRGLPFGDGLRCAGGGVVRLEVRMSDLTGKSSTRSNLVAAGGVSAGNTRTYQLWYRDSLGNPCGSSFNLSNGLRIAWQP